MVCESEAIKLKKLLRLTALAAVLVLSACDGSSGEAVCTGQIDDLFGMGLQAEMTTIPQVEGNYITAIEFNAIVDVSDIERDKAEELAELFDGTIEGDYIIVSQTYELEEEEEYSVEEYIDEMESDLYTCT